MAVDVTDGAAVWTLLTPGSGRPDNGGLSRRNGAGWAIGRDRRRHDTGWGTWRTWASPTVDATHAGSTHVALAGTVEPETTWGITPDEGIAATASRSDHTHGSPPKPSGGELLITDTPAGSPLIFADIIQNEDGTDLLYSD